MNIQDQTLFKSFIEGQGLREVFLKGYRRSAQFAGNPSSVEKYLNEVKAENAIIDAIKTYTTNSHFGYDFWQNASENWNTFLNKGRTWHSYEDKEKLMCLEGMYKVLRENWDAAKTWLYEDVDKALIRMGLITSEEEEKVEEESTNPTRQMDFSGVPEADDDLEFFDLNTNSRNRTGKLKVNEATLNFRSHSNKFTFNQTTSRKIQKNDYKYVRLAKNKQGDIVLQLHKIEMTDCRQVTVTYNNSSGGTGAVNACINSKDLCTKLKTLLNLTGDIFTLHIEELYMDFDKANFKISK